MLGAANKFEEMKRERSNIVQAKTEELEARVNEVLVLFDAGQQSRAKLKALSIKWTPIGTTDVDEERGEHFSKIRDELITLIEEN